MTRLCWLAYLAVLAALTGCAPSGSQTGATGAGAVRCAAPTELALPPGFCASVFADKLGPARHIAVRDNGDVFVSLRGDDGGIVALRDEDGDGVADRQVRFGSDGGTGLQVWRGYLYFATPTTVLRYALPDDDGLAPQDEPEVVVAGFLEQPQHASKTIAINDTGELFVNIGAPSNACQDPPRSPAVAGMDPCPQRDGQAGIWRFAASELGQDALSDGTRYASGIRNAMANEWNDEAGRLYVVQHGRDQLSELWPDIYTDEQRAELPAEEFFAVDENDDFGWPYCFYDQLIGRKVLAPEYGGDGSTSGRCSAARDPLVAFPGHWAPNDLVFYRGRAFPSYYRNGAFIAFHGSWNRAPFPQQGYQVAFVPLKNGMPSGEFETFADGFAGPGKLVGPGDARHRPTGLGETPDGALLIADSRVGRVWRVTYATPAESALALTLDAR